MATKPQTKASEKAEKVMQEKKAGTLKSGSGKKVTSEKQAIASVCPKRARKVPGFPEGLASIVEENRPARSAFLQLSPVWQLRGYAGDIGWLKRRCPPTTVSRCFRHMTGGDFRTVDRLEATMETGTVMYHNRSTRKFVVHVDPDSFAVFAVVGKGTVKVGDRLAGPYHLERTRTLRNLRTVERLDVVNYATGCDLKTARGLIAPHTV